MRLPIADESQFVFRQQARVDFINTRIGRNRLRDALIVASEHHQPDVLFLESGHGFLCFGPQHIANGNQTSNTFTDSRMNCAS